MEDEPNQGATPDWNSALDRDPRSVLLFGPVTRNMTPTRTLQHTFSGLSNRRFVLKYGAYVVIIMLTYIRACLRRPHVVFTFVAHM